MIIGLCVIGLTSLLPPDLLKMIMTLLGAYQGKEFVKFIFKQKESINDLKTGDFYIPLLYNKQNITFDKKNK